MKKEEIQKVIQELKVEYETRFRKTSTTPAAKLSGIKPVFEKHLSLLEETFVEDKLSEKVKEQIFDEMMVTCKHYAQKSDADVTFFHMNISMKGSIYSCVMRDWRLRHSLLWERIRNGSK